ncbi:MAG: hypothetical protein WCK58_04910 [Chloroflexota bacterium]
MRRVLPLILSFAVIGAVAALPGAATSAAASPAVTADLDGLPIPIADIPNHFCHDHAFPVIHCFSTAAALEAAIGAPVSTVTSLAAGPVPLTPAPGDYVTIYSGLSWSGSYMYVGQDYDTLAFVGWNDRIRSYRSVNSGRGIFWTDWYRAGNSLSFCCNVMAASLSSTFDQQITSVYRQ